MIIFGPFDCLYDFSKDYVVLNFTSLKEGLERLNLIPPFQCQYGNEKIFDVNYANYLLSDDNAFSELMKIIYPLFLGKDVYIAISSMQDPAYTFVMEALQKFIITRYGYVYNMIYTMDDWQCVVNGRFSIIGLYNVDIDMKRFQAIYIRSKGLENFNNCVITEDDLLNN